MNGGYASLAIEYGPATVLALAVLWVALVRDSCQKMLRTRTRPDYWRA